jgi:hypothetical protein
MAQQTASTLLQKTRQMSKTVKNTGSQNPNGKAPTTLQNAAKTLAECFTKNVVKL